MLKTHPGNLAILTDFDGTITTVDTNSKLIQMYGNQRILKLRQQYRNNEIDFLALIKLQFTQFKLTEEEYKEFIIKKFGIAEGFLDFYNNIKEKNIPFAIVSGGFDNAIIPFLEKHGISGVDIYANSFIFNHDRISVRLYDEQVNTICNGYGPCGNCKVRHYKNYKKKNKTVIFIGDGSTDYCVAKLADIVFAKNQLLNYCKKNGIECIPWKDFNDINKIIFNK